MATCGDKRRADAGTDLAIRERAVPGRAGERMVSLH